MNENAALERARGFRVGHPARGVGFGLLWEPTAPVRKCEEMWENAGNLKNFFIR